jgi:hypothetical protein
MGTTTHARESAISHSGIARSSLRLSAALGVEIDDMPGFLQA